MENKNKIQFSQDSPSLYGVKINDQYRGVNDQIRASLFSSSLRIDKELMPDIAEVIDQVKNQLEVNFNVEAYIYNDPTANAACMDYGSSTSVIILISSGLIQLLSLEELRFVIGHEVGHYIYGHHFYPDPEKAKNKFSRLNLYELKRAAEISADRIGFLCSDSLESVFRTVLKVSTGLPDTYFRFDFSSYIQQLNDLNTLGGHYNNIDQTHPVQHLRLKALLLFSMTHEYYDLKRIDKASPLSIEQIDKKIIKDLNASSGFILDEIRSVAFQNAKMWTLLYMALSDNRLSKEEQVLIKRQFGEGEADEAIEYARAHGPEGVQKKFEESMRSLKNQPEHYKKSFEASIDTFLTNLDDGSEDIKRFYQIIHSRLHG